MFVKRVDVILLARDRQLQFCFEQMMHSEVEDSLFALVFGGLFVSSRNRFGSEFHDLLVSFASKVGLLFEALCFGIIGAEERLQFDLRDLVDKPLGRLLLGSFDLQVIAARIITLVGGWVVSRLRCRHRLRVLSRRLSDSRSRDHCLIVLIIGSRFLFGLLNRVWLNRWIIFRRRHRLCVAAATTSRESCRRHQTTSEPPNLRHHHRTFLGCMSLRVKTLPIGWGCRTLSPNDAR